MKKITNHQELLQRMQEVEREGDFYLARMQNEVTNVSTYLPFGKFTESLSMDTFADVSLQLQKHGLKLGIVVPLFLNNTFFKNKDDATKALVTALGLFIDKNIDLKDLADRLLNFFSSDEGQKHLHETGMLKHPSSDIKPVAFNKMKQ